MEVTVKWEWDNSSPNYPWVYQVRMGEEEERGRVRTLADCWVAIDSFISETVAEAIQEAECQSRN